MRRTFAGAVVALALLALPALARGQGLAACHMRFSLEGWSFFYKTASGTGTVTCSNGQAAQVRLRIKGGGLTFGRTRLVDGRATFTQVRDLRDLFGSYAATSAHAGAGRAAAAQVMSNGRVSVALTATGHGASIGFDFGRLVIEPLSGPD